ncbi:similar to Saccharomyces cerevisiae YMR285C NGL2 Protein involved in 5.8S rRNA processing [Maudiozyma saulgeensis]|uniref:Similar to Saccharomyces cerevisiae YMR285C NGL2 Protein involved in 5.8S rRNA processing n=1 Tax=Maudiozyma saulgeensis TaxID=1789683 RepID=A0A1X7R4B1_9SACH|nr:similar to Saccharomyces cerevisiae YMR285C NGL2 Protein involved in 5.8S rRNA processing [Kazachstania saulgeensis]
MYEEHTELAKNEAPKHIKLPREDITPEFIAWVRERRAIERRKRERQLKFDPKYDFIKRELLEIPHPVDEELSLNDTNSINVKIMTYNILAQSLIRRELFPEAHDAIRWSNRSRTFINLFRFYDADVICMQEVDIQQWEKFWVPQMQELGYEGRFFRGTRTKVHGVAIFWKVEMFDCADKLEINLDNKIDLPNEVYGVSTTRTKTRNAALILALQFRHKRGKRKGILIGTTHLFWHPFGTFERVRQLYLILENYKKFIVRMNGNTTETTWLPFLTGDFNSQPSDSPYLALTSKPTDFKGQQRAILECSATYRYSKRRNGTLQHESESESESDEHEDENEHEDEEGENIMQSNPTDARPKIFHANEEQRKSVNELQKIYNMLDLKATSLYSLGYRYVHPANTVFENMHNGEPEMSQSAINWTGLLDYIFFIDKWDGSVLGNTSDIGIHRFEEKNLFRINALLRMPRKDEMPKHVQPHMSEFPSDHLSMICDLQIKL